MYVLFWNTYNVVLGFYNADNGYLRKPVGDTIEI